MKHKHRSPNLVVVAAHAVRDHADILKCLFALSVGLWGGSVISVLWQAYPAFILPAFILVPFVITAAFIPWMGGAAHIDTKTGLLSPEHFERRFQRAIYRARRPGAPLALILIDLDSLKNANDTYGHLAGDAVLRTLGTLIREHVRMPHLAGRVGGDEFGIALPDATAEDARALAERLRVVIAAAEIYIATSPDVLRITVSLGIAQLSLEHSQADDLFHAADMALICAKRLGRNRVVSATQSNIPAAKKGAKAAVAELEAEDSEDTRYIWQEVSRIH